MGSLCCIYALWHSSAMLSGTVCALDCSLGLNIISSVQSGYIDKEGKRVSFRLFGFALWEGMNDFSPTHIRWNMIDCIALVLVNTKDIYGMIICFVSLLLLLIWSSLLDLCLLSFPCFLFSSLSSSSYRPGAIGPSDGYSVICLVYYFDFRLFISILRIRRLIWLSLVYAV